MRTDDPCSVLPFRVRAILRSAPILSLATMLWAWTWLGCGAPEDADANGASEASRGDVPTRLVSLAPSITEILFELGLGDRIRGVTSYCDYPPAALALPKIGGLLDPNIEAIMALRPDLVILLRTHENATEQLQALGLPALLVGGSTVEEVLRSISDIGEACGCAAKGRELSQTLRRHMSRLAEAVAAYPKPRVLLSIGRTLGEGTLKDIYVAGDDGYFSELIRMAGGRNACDEQTIAFPLVSQEGILQMAPDVIIELAADLERNGYSVEDVRREWQVLKHVPAVDHERVHVFTEDYVTVPGPRFILLLDHMARVLHPDVELPPLEDKP